MPGMLYNLDESPRCDHSREEQDMAQMTGGEAVIQALRHEGVEVVLDYQACKLWGSTTPSMRGRISAS